LSEIRKDPASLTWIISATERGKRPTDFKEEEKPQRRVKRTGCPFCAGGEEMKAPLREHAIWPGEQDKKTLIWKTRVLPNKYPALYPDVELSQAQKDTIYHYLSGVGGHEVIVDSPNHDDTLATMSIEQISAILRTYRQRYRFWWTDPRITYLLVYRNYGVEAGASLGHPHSQAMATPIIPHRIYEELEEGRNYYDQNQECVYCRTIQVEKENEPSRKVFENEAMFAFCPFASRFPFEIWILPKDHYSTLEGIPQKKINYLAEALSEVFKKLNEVLGDIAYNMIVHSAPLRTPGLLYYHWHIEVLPRLTMPAGFEWGAGIYINIISPEDAAVALREA